jgi:hypothetical protein
MKQTLLLTLATLLVSLCAVSADEPARTLNFINTPVQKILPIYHELSGLELIEASDVTKLHSVITLRTTAPVSKAEMVKLMEKALVEQAGVVISRLDAQRASVTYNDALPILPAGDGD